MKYCRICQIEIEQIFYESHSNMRWRGEYSGQCNRNFLDHDGRLKRCIDVFCEELIKHMKRYYFLSFDPLNINIKNRDKCNKSCTEHC